jgi:hypothetical protein
MQRKPFYLEEGVLQKKKSYFNNFTTSRVIKVLRYEGKYRNLSLKEVIQSHTLAYLSMNLKYINNVRARETEKEKQ